jgi:hypothetical protein
VLPITLSVLHGLLPNFKSSDNIWGATLSPIYRPIAALVVEKKGAGIRGKFRGDMSTRRSMPDWDLVFSNDNKINKQTKLCTPILV